MRSLVEAAANPKVGIDAYWWMADKAHSVEKGGVILPPIALVHITAKYMGLQS